MTSAALAERDAKYLTVLIADDYPLVREGIKLLIAGMVGSANFREVADGDALLTAMQRSPAVDIALVDVKMPRMQGGLRLCELARRHPKLPIVVISALGSDDVVRRVMSIPTVYAFVPKTASSSVTRSAIEAALQGRKLPYVEGRGAEAPAEIGLTPRQREICNLLRQGLRNKTIAQILGISEGTVKNHITDIFRALRATNRTQAARIGAETE